MQVIKDALYTCIVQAIYFKGRHGMFTDQNVVFMHGANFKISVWPIIMELFMPIQPKLWNVKWLSEL